MKYNHLKPAAAAAATTAALLSVLLSCARAKELNNQRQIETTTSAAPKTDGQVAEKDFVEHLKEGNKYFQDIYVGQTSPEELEFGHVRETPDNWEQRFEKIDANGHRHQGKDKVGEFDELEEKKTGTGPDIEKLKEKVRWGDKFGTYGEHYFDFNHDGGGGGDGGDAGAPKAAEDADAKKEKLTQKTNKTSDALTEDPSRDRRNLLGNADVEFISDAAREKIITGATGMHGGNYKTEETGRVKRQDTAEFPDAVAQE